MKKTIPFIILISILAAPVVVFAQEPPTTYVIPLPSGASGHVIMTITAGEAAIAAAVMVLAAITLFRLLQATAQAAKAK